MLKQEHVDKSDIQNYIKKVGIENVRREDLEQLINKMSGTYIDPIEIYRIVSIRETNKKNDKNAKTMERWTKIVGWLTVIMVIATIIPLFSRAH